MPRTDAASGPPSSSSPSAASRISSSGAPRRGPRRDRVAGADILGQPLDVGRHTVELFWTSYKFCTSSRRAHMLLQIPSPGLRRTTGGLFIAGALAFAGAATVLSSTFEWPDVLREPADVVLPAFVAGGTSLVWTWVATAWTDALLLVPILMLPAVLGRRGDPVLRAATYVGATSVVLSLIGFLRWVFVVPPLADSYVAGDATARAAVDAAWTAQHQFGGALLGEHLGQLLVICWSVTVSVVILRTGVLPRWLGVTGLAVSVLYLFNQGDILQ